jgi:hypothetical protein
MARTVLRSLARELDNLAEAPASIAEAAHACALVEARGLELTRIADAKMAQLVELEQQIVARRAELEQLEPSGTRRRKLRLAP